MKKTHCQLILTALLIVVVCGCSADSDTEIESFDSLTLYSIDGNGYPPGKAPAAKEKFHGYPVLGKLEIKNADRRKEDM